MDEIDDGIEVPEYRYCPVCVCKLPSYRHSDVRFESFHTMMRHYAATHPNVTPPGDGSNDNGRAVTAKPRGSDHTIPHHIDTMGEDDIEWWLGQERKHSDQAHNTWNVLGLTAPREETHGSREA